MSNFELAKSCLLNKFSRVIENKIVEHTGDLNDGAKVKIDDNYTYYAVPLNSSDEVILVSRYDKSDETLTYEGEYKKNKESWVLFNEK